MADVFMQMSTWRTEDFRGEYVRDWMQGHTDVPVLAVVFYLALVLYVPQHVMAHRRPLNLRFLNIVWNLLLTVFSICGAYHCVPRLLELVISSRISGMTAGLKLGPNTTVPELQGGLYNSACAWNDKIFFDGTVGIWVSAFILSKIPEMLDTVFLVFQKKSVIFLHWYHHATVMLFCWHAYAYTISSGLWFATMNYCVHAIMYFYYFICACGLRKMIRPIAPFITMMQLLQMVVGTLIVGYTAYHSYLSGYGCEVNRTSIRLGLVMYISYFILFLQLYHRSYIKPKANPALKMSNGEKKYN
ncbi:fatty acid elongase [Trypanosoma rangeli]|uniref:Elongation of fatty acids protein n=1 Tax=Trypanosoma rangeli TaxID=5698 RepID=A0A422NNP1_TRYRA|nr:fatty acid elongase [Trypanosoma rangeli]RNF07093.1 fatty acid elongase [Trypanosoma rangeli]|eukprot:RNF07093.1 fatty acid elongase [Trypanosoma rangeli]